jgi:hypothetical protein
MNAYQRLDAYMPERQADYWIVEDIHTALEVARAAEELLDVLGEEGRLAIPPAADLRGCLNALLGGS